MIILLLLLIIILLLIGPYLSKAPKISGSQASPMLVPVNVRTRGPISAWKVVGILHSQSLSDNTIFSLEAREIDRGRSKFEYRVIDKVTGVVINLFEGAEVAELSNGDLITVTGFESVGQFVVVLNKTDALKYLPYF